MEDLPREEFDPTRMTAFGGRYRTFPRKARGEGGEKNGCAKRAILFASSNNILSKDDEEIRKILLLDVISLNLLMMEGPHLYFLYFAV